MEAFMADTSSNAMWENFDKYDGFELSRPQIFREETRPLFFEYFRINESSAVLDGGCGPGVLTRFIAKGLKSGTVTGFDISESFVRYGNERIAEQGLSDRAKIVKDDGFNLSFADNSFDAVVSHNYLGVLSDPIAGLTEMIRVCKPGGAVSVSASIGGPGLAARSWEGEYQIGGIKKLKELYEKYSAACRKVFTAENLNQSAEWPAQRYPKLFSKLGLKNISIKAVGSSFAYDDAYWPDEYRVRKITADVNDEIRQITENAKEPGFAENGFTAEDGEEMVRLMRVKQDYLLANYKTDDSWEWHAGLSCIFTGIKPE